jgi:hypothetical protein
MPHYLDEYAPKTGRWKAPSGRRYDIIEVDPSRIKLIPGRAFAVADNEDAAALFFGFVLTPLWKRPNPLMKTDLSEQNIQTTKAINQLVKHLLSTGAKEAIIPVTIHNEHFEVVVRRKVKNTTIFQATGK